MYMYWENWNSKKKIEGLIFILQKEILHTILVDIVIETTIIQHKTR